MLKTRGREGKSDYGYLLLNMYVREYLENRVIILCYFHVRQESTAEVFDTLLSADCSLLPPAHPSSPGESEHTSQDSSLNGECSASICFIVHCSLCLSIGNA